MQAWYLIYAKARQENLARENLRRQGFEAYLPLIRNRRRRQGRFQLIVEPMFPRYLFVRLDDVTDNWGPIRSTLGVSNLVRFGDRPGKVPDSLISVLMARDDEAGIQQLPIPEFKPGAKVRIVEGAMAGYEGIYRAATSQERVVVLLNIVGRSARVQLPAGHIEAV